MGLSRYQRVAFLINEYYRLKDVLKEQVEKIVGHTIIGISDIEIDGDSETIVAYYEFFDDDYDFWDRKSYDKHVLQNCCDVTMDKLNDFFN